MTRSDSLAWLRQDPDEGCARILTNARCLTEGIDVPALDAIMFLEPRNSEIDVVQAVGRVMRKSAGKRFGYIILPIARALGSSPQDTVNDSAYKAVWQVINAIAAHDDRFEAKINQLKLVVETEKPLPGSSEGSDIGGGESVVDVEQRELPLAISGSPEFRDAILSRVVDKYSNPRYWEQWADRVREIAERHEARIRGLLAMPDSGVRSAFDRFLAGLRSNLNDGVTEDEAIGTLSQHLVSKPVFDALFEDYDFVKSNPVSVAMQGAIDALQDRELEKETKELERFYRDVRIRADGVTTTAGKQKIIAELYERFLTKALPETAKNLGIAYTPVQVVDYIIRSVEDVLNAEFGASLGDAGVHVIDPFVGTGTFITRLIQSGLIEREDLRRKYKSELHANEIMLLAYYIAMVNIESTYHEAIGANEYASFVGGVLTDTFQAYEPKAPMDNILIPSNNEQMERQRELNIRVVIGNPPWSATNNRKYPGVDDRVKESYVDSSNTGHRAALYDPYVKAIRLASDRILNDKGGVVAFVTNAGFIRSNAFDGFRKAVAEEFTSIYVLNLRGNQRTHGERSRQEGGKVFGQSSRAPVAITLLIRNPNAAHDGCRILYRDIGDYMTRERKLEILGASRLAETDWEDIVPNEHGDWIEQRSDEFQTFHPLTPSDAAIASGEPTPIFVRRTLGLLTSRDAWAFNSSRYKLRDNIRRSVDYYNERVAVFRRTNSSGSVNARTVKAKEFVSEDPRQFHWDDKNYRDLANGESYRVDESGFRIGVYRPFFKQRLYFERKLNNSIRDFPEIYPDADAENCGIYITGPGSSAFSTLMTNTISDSGLTSGNGSSPYIPRWRYQRSSTLGVERVSNINPQALKEFRARYRDSRITEDDLFYYVYGVLHSAQWRKAFANDLKKSQARIPMVASVKDFRVFAQAGMELAKLHVGYETVEPYPLKEIRTGTWNPRSSDAYRVINMKYPGKRSDQDKTRIVYNAGLTLAGIPLQAHEYVLGTRSALDWLIERYRVRTHTASGISNDPNDWATEIGDPRYILNLIKRVTTVSVRTVEIVNGLPDPS